MLAPAPTLSAGSVPNRVLSVVLREGEEVRWTWTFASDGSYVSGYEIFRATRKRLAPRELTSSTAFQVRASRTLTALFPMDRGAV